MGERGMADMGEMEMPLPDNTLPMMTGQGPFGPIEMGGMFTVVKVREGLAARRLPGPGLVQASRRHARLRVDRGAAAGRARRRAGRRSEGDDGEKGRRRCASLVSVRSPSLAVPFAAQAHGDGRGSAPRTQPMVETEFGRTGDPKQATRTIRIDMSDTMRFTPDALEVRQGDTVRFVVKNSGKTMHEMVIGTIEGTEGARRGHEEASRDGARRAVHGARRARQDRTRSSGSSRSRASSTTAA